MTRGDDEKLHSRKGPTIPTDLTNILEDVKYPLTDCNPSPQKKAMETTTKVAEPIPLTIKEFYEKYNIPERDIPSFPFNYWERYVITDFKIIKKSV